MTAKDKNSTFAQIKDFSRFFSPLPASTDWRCHPFSVFVLILLTFILVFGYQIEEVQHWAHLTLPESTGLTVQSILEKARQIESDAGVIALSRKHRQAFAWLESSPILFAGPATAQASTVKEEPRKNNPESAQEEVPQPQEKPIAEPIVKEPAKIEQKPAAVPTQDFYKIMVIGDSMAQGIAAGLKSSFGNYSNVKLIDKTRCATGLVRVEYFNWEKNLNKYLRQHDADAAVVVLGTNDGQGMYLEKKKVAYFATEEWDARYRTRVDSIIETLKKNNVKIFWVGLPMVRSSSLAEKMRHLNEIFQERTSKQNVPFIPIWEMTSGQTGGFNSYITRNDGRRYKVRNNDGIHFNLRGYIFLAEYVLVEMKKHLALLPKQVQGT